LFATRSRLVVFSVTGAQFKPNLGENNL
jgi:hypothetical protein